MTKPQALLKMCRMAAIAALAITPALAVEVTYNTTGTFSSSGTNVYTGANGLTLTYGNTVGNTVSLSGAPSNASFGTFTTINPTSGASDTVNSHFSLLISQTLPSGASETLTDSFAGTISTSPTGDSSTVVLTFTGGSTNPILGTDPIDGARAYTFSLGSITYWVDQKTPVEPQTTNGGVSTINGAVSAVPEPTFYALTGLGFIGLMAMAIRRRRQQTAV